MHQGDNRPTSSESADQVDDHSRLSFGEAREYALTTLSYAISSLEDALNNSSAIIMFSPVTPKFFGMLCKAFEPLGFGTNCEGYGLFYIERIGVRDDSSKSYFVVGFYDGGYRHFRIKTYCCGGEFIRPDFTYNAVNSSEVEVSIQMRTLLKKLKKALQTWKKFVRNYKTYESVENLMCGHPCWKDAVYSENDGTRVGAPCHPEVFNCLNLYSPVHLAQSIGHSAAPADEHIKLDEAETVIAPKARPKKRKKGRPADPETVDLSILIYRLRKQSTPTPYEEILRGKRETLSRILRTELGHAKEKEYTDDELLNFVTRLKDRGRKHLKAHPSSRKKH